MEGQVFTWDFIFATGIFLIILAGVIYLWDNTIYEIDSAERNYEADRISEMAIEQLVRIPGIPGDWWKNPKNVTVLGLVNSGDYGGYSRILDTDKLLHFSNLIKNNYSIIRNRLLGTGKYDFYVDFSCLNDSNRECFSGIHVDSIDTGNITCSNGFNFSVIDNRITSYPWREAEGYNAEDGTETKTNATVSNGKYIKLGANDWILYNMSFPADGNYRLWTRCSKTGAELRDITVDIDGISYFNLTCPTTDWNWTSSDDAKEINAGVHSVKMSKTTDFIDLDSILLTTDFSYNPNNKSNFGNFNIIPPVSCISGNYTTGNSNLILSDTKTAVLGSNPDRIIRLKLVVWN